MIEIAPDRPDFDEYDAELARVHRHHKRLAYEMILADERMEEEVGYNRSENNYHAGERKNFLQF
ncbi:MAG: hypothetical protein HDQ95_10360 [Roseburia sp.]|nr:hypothetical protein [Roseburia sp.]